MAAHDRQTLETEVKLALGNRTDVDTQITNWVKRGYQHLTQTVEFPEAETLATQVLVVGQRAYALPTDFFSMYTVRDSTNERRILQISPTDYQMLNTTTQTKPDRYSVFNNFYNVHATPDATDTHQLRYRKMFPELSLITSIHELPEVWEQPIINFAIAFGMEALNEIERAAYYRGSARAFINEQQPRLAWDLYDRSEAPQVLGGEIV